MFDAVFWRFGRNCDHIYALAQMEFPRLSVTKPAVIIKAVSDIIFLFYKYKGLPGNTIKMSCLGSPFLIISLFEKLLLRIQICLKLLCNFRSYYLNIIFSFLIKFINLLRVIFEQSALKLRPVFSAGLI